MDKENIQEENTVINNTENKKKKVVLAIPGDEFSSKFLIAFANTIISLFASDKYTFIIAPGTGSFVPFVRMTTLGLDVKRGADQKPFNGGDFDYWITIDSDVIYSTEHIFQLLESLEKHPVVAGMYRMADLQNFAFVQKWDLNYQIKNGNFEFVTPEFVEKWKKETELKYLPVNYTGLGFFGCRKEVLWSMKYPYFDGEVTEIKTEEGLCIRDISSEDVNFCHNIAKAGYEIVIDTDIRVGHLKKLLI